MRGAEHEAGGGLRWGPTNATPGSGLRTATVRVDLDAPLLSETSPAFLGVNIDSASLYQGARLDFSDKDLVQLASRLAAAGLYSEGREDGDGVDDRRMTLRLGGSAADDLSTFVNDTDAGHIFLNEDYWDELIDFVSECGFHLAWDLNMRIGRSNDGRAKWDPVDAKRLLSRVKRKNQRVWAYQLGNEPGHWQTRNGGHPNAKNHGQDFQTLKSLLKATGQQDSRIMGPDVCFGNMTSESPCADANYFRELLVSAGPQTIQDITVHAYGLTGPKQGRPANATNCFVEDFLNRSEYRQKVIPAVLQWQSIAKEVSPNANIVLSETATADDGGCPGLSNSFLAGFYFVDILGELAEIGVSQVYRQDLVGFSGINGGSSYALLGQPGWHNKNSSGPLTPNPDYFTALVYRTLVGSKRLKVSTSFPSNDTERRGGHAPMAYAACAVGGGVAISFLNPRHDSILMSVSVIDQGKDIRNVDSGQATPLDTYIFTSPGGNLTSPHIELNGEIMTPSSQVTGKAGDGSRIVKIPPQSYGFVVDRSATGKHCT